MEVMERLSSHLKTRMVDLRKAKRDGTKVVGYMPGGYLPEELVLAAGAIPICLARGGDHKAVELAGAYVVRWLDTFCRAQIGYALSGDDPYYNVIDTLAIPITDNHMRGVSDILGSNTDLDVFPFGVPHKKDRHAFQYYLQGITKLKSKLEELTGREITESRLREAIELCNRERDLFRNISLMRKSGSIAIRSKDFVGLHHASFFADKRVMVDALGLIHESLKDGSPPAQNGPRILLTGSTLAQGDSNIQDLIEQAGGVVVIEEFGEGMRPYWDMVKPEGNLLENLAECYFWRRVPPAWFRPDAERLDFLVQLTKDYNVAGVIWYQLMYRESYKLECYYFPDILKRKTGLSMLTLDSDYDTAETGQMRTRVDTFIETIRRS